MRLIVYSHDAFGLGNIRRMLSICQHLLATIPEVSILVLSGSPAIHNFKIPARLDYIKLPCLGRDRYGNLAAKYLTSDATETVKLRSSLIKTAIINFQPNLVLVDKKPYGLLGELKPALDLLKTSSPQTKLILLLRDILDAPQVTIREWQKQRYYQAIQDYYDRILVVGMSEVFNLLTEYNFPQGVAEKTAFCGYIKKPFSQFSTFLIRQQLGLKELEKLIVVTPGGGEDGYFLINNYLAAINKINNACDHKSLIIFGSEMPGEEKDKLSEKIARYSNIITLDFTDCLLNYIQAANLVVSMAGYNTITEILSLGKKAVVVPRYKPSQEQFIRASRMARLGLLTMILPHKLTRINLSQAINSHLDNQRKTDAQLNFDGLSNIQREVINLLGYGSNINLVINSDRINLHPLIV